MAKTLIEKALAWGRVKSLWIADFHSGTCNGCAVELNNCIALRRELAQLGVARVSSPLHADILIVSGLVTISAAEELKRLYEQIPAPKYVIALGACACSGGVFADCHAVCGGVDSVIPVDVFVPGCAVSPDSIIDGIRKLVEKLEQQLTDDLEAKDGY